MTALSWLRGLIAHRRSRLVGTAIGVAVAVALIASIGTFLSATTSKMTTRAAATVAADWQVEVRPGADPARALRQVRSFDTVTRALPVNFASTSGLAARTGGSTQQTGPGSVLGIPPGFAKAFPGEIRRLSGGPGVLLAQQTAANLNAKPGQIVEIGRLGLPAARVRVAGVVELPAADSLFQNVGAPIGSQPQAPPDNVVMLPQRLFERIESPAPAAPSQLLATQIFASVDRALPSSPSAAFIDISGQARNLETRLAGGGLVGDNLGSALDGARADALYAQILFLFLGLPGAMIAGFLTAAIASAGSDRRRRDAALLRTRGASTRALVRIALSETAAATALGVGLGLGIALVVGQISFGTANFGAGTTAAALWASGAALVGSAIATMAIAVPAWRDARGLTVAGQRRQIGRRDRPPRWARYGLDCGLLIVSALVYRQASSNGYQLVLAPEGVPKVSVNWYALIAPAFAWIGAGLLSYRLADAFLDRGSRPLAVALRPLAGNLSMTVAATMRRGRGPLARSVALLALTAAFAASTAVFNSTYRQQAEVDARLSNGADVTVSESPGNPVGPGQGEKLASLAGVAGVEPLQHRFAYVGADLQDLYGVRADSIGSAASLQDAWFQGGSAAELIGKLADEPDSLLVSAETVTDFQLHPGDLIKLRLQDGVSKQFKTVPFHYVGVALEFPTAPHDSFFVANADYVAQQTGSNAVASLLIQTDGTNPATVASTVRASVGTSAQVTDIVNQRKVIGSNLTAVELSGLTRIELGFALVLAVAAGGLALALGFNERRRSFAIATALGARRRQLGGFICGEAAFVTAAGLGLGAAIATAMSVMLVKVLTGVFDPPPDALAVPGLYLVGALATVLLAVAVAAAAMLRSLRRPAIEQLRDL